MKKNLLTKLIAGILMFCITGSLFPAWAAAGDMNGDLQTDERDCRAIKSFFWGEELSQEELKIADINQDGKITSADFVMAKKQIGNRSSEYGKTPAPLEKQPEIQDPGEKITYTVSGAFTSDMVLQRDKVIRVWGWSKDKGGYIYGELFGEKRYAEIDKQGEWMLEFSPHAYTTEGTTLKIYPKNGKETVFEDVLIGDVWLVSGQSNAEYMFWQMAEYYTDTYNLIDEKDNIRLLKIDKGDAYNAAGQRIPNGVQKDIINKKNRWKKTTKSTVEPFSALGYIFAKEIIKNTDVPQGMIMAAAGGCILQEFMDPETGKNYDNKNAVWTRENNSIYKYFIAPFRHMSFQGVLFYQGESNAEERLDYEKKLIDFVEGWREVFDSDFTFYNFQCSTHTTRFGSLPFLRSAQLNAFRKIPDSYLITTLDAGYSNKGGNEDPSHPYDKLTIGKRAAHLALAELYRIDGYTYENYASPMPIRHEFKDGYVYIDFENIGDGLKTADGKSLVGFYGTKKKTSVATEAELVDKDTVKIKIPEDEKVTGIGYASDKLSLLEHANMVNSNGIPTPSFIIPLPEDLK